MPNIIIIMIIIIIIISLCDVAVKYVGPIERRRRRSPVQNGVHA